jgi:preprotein translocase subunit SecD
VTVLNRYPTWKNVLVVLAVLVGSLFALPNVFGDDPAIQISLESTQPLDDTTVTRVEGVLQLAGITGSWSVSPQSRSS